MKKTWEPLIQSMRAAWKPQDIRTPWEWCEDNITVDNTSPFPGKWRSATSPWVKEPMEVAADRRVSFIAIRCSAQSSKTQTVLNLLCYDIAEDPGPEMYVMANQTDAEDFVRDRFRPTMINCAATRSRMLRETKAAFTFSTMPLYFVGAGSLGKLQGKPMKRLRLDEVRNWPKGALPTVMKRVRAFSQLGSQIFLISTPDMADDEVDAAFKQGDQRTFHFPCPECGQMQQLRRQQLKAIHPETGEVCKWSEVPGAKDGDKWIFDKLAPWIRYVCEKCSRTIADTPAERKAICRSGRFIRMNPSAPAHHVSFTWNALLPWWVPWRSIVEEFINARDALRHGDTEPMKTFVNETMGEPWEDQLGVIEDFGFLESRKGDYNLGDPWSEEVARFMFADRQEGGGEHYWYVVRAFGMFGKSRLIGYGRCESEAQLEEVRKAFNVTIGPENGKLVSRAAIDSGWKASEVYKFCLSTKWRAFKGEPNAEWFPHRVEVAPGKFKMVRRVWEKTHVDPFLGQRVGQSKTLLPLFRHCGNATKDILAEFMQGLVGEWTIAKNTGRDYMQQVTAEKRGEHKDPRGQITREWKRIRKDNHLFDCEVGITVQALITKHIARGEKAAKVAKPETAIGNVPQSTDGTDCNSGQAGQAEAVL